MRVMTKILGGADVRALPNAGIDYFEADYASVYRNNSMSAFHDALRSNYKSVAKLVGETYFAYLARAYIKNYPVKARTLVGYGKDFDQIVDDYAGEHKLPYLSDFARLDYLWLGAHLAADSSALNMEYLTGVLEAGGDLGTQKLHFRPDVMLAQTAWPVFDVWSKLRADHELGESMEMNEGTQSILIWRFQNEVMQRSLQDNEYTFLRTIKDGGTLGEAMAAALAAQPGADINTMLPNMMGAKIFAGESHV